jgi:hypothetical protein
MVRDIIVCVVGIVIGSLSTLLILNRRIFDLRDQLENYEYEIEMIRNKNKSLYDDNCILKTQLYRYKSFLANHIRIIGKLTIDKPQ